MRYPKKTIGKKRIIYAAVAMAVILAVAAGLFLLDGRAGKTGSATAIHLERSDWDDDVKTALNELVDTYGASGSTPTDSPYAVFDFDNTCSIFDMEEQTAVYQLQTMAFAIEPDQIREVLLTGLPDPDTDVSQTGYFSGSFSELAQDIEVDYSILWDRYGPFTGKGLSEDTVEELPGDPYWQDFAARVFVMYEAIGDICSHDVAYPWMTYLFTGMTEEELYDLTIRALDEYGETETSEVTWTSPAEIRTKTGIVSCTWASGASVTANINELWEVLDGNGIDVWVCSASATSVIRAAIDHFGLHDHCKGMLGMTDRIDESGHIINDYDYDCGCGYYATDSGWERMNRPIRTQTQGAGKVTAIENAIEPEYDGHGPIAGFMDSTGDFNFCTEFETLRLVVCFNRANRAVTEGGGLIAETAVYQKDTLDYDLEKAASAGDTLYLLQGRDENGTRLLRNSRSTLRYGQKEEALFKGEENYTQLKMFKEAGLSTEDILNTWSLKRDAEESGLGFETGFLTEYDGYHSHK